MKYIDMHIEKIPVEEKEKVLKLFTKFNKNIGDSKIEYLISQEYLTEKMAYEIKQVDYPPYTIEKIELVKTVVFDLIVNIPESILKSSSDWVLVGKFDIQEINGKSSVIIDKVYDIKIPEKYYHITDTICEHCNVKRYRINYYLAHNLKTGEWLKLGKNCLEYYLGKNWENILHNTTYIIKIIRKIQDEAEDKKVYKNNSAQYLEEVIAAIYAIEIFALENNIKADVNNSLWDIKINLLSDIYFGSGLKGVEADIKKDLKNIVKNKSAAIKKEYDNFKKFVKSSEGYESKIFDFEFQRKLDTIVERDFVTLNQFKFIYLGYLKYLKSLNIKSKKLNQSYFGEVGKKYEEKLKFIYSASFENKWGVTKIYAFQTINDNKLLWKTQKYLTLIKNDEYTVKFTVKSHSEYRDEKQTEITRCKIFDNGFEITR